MAAAFIKVMYVTRAACLKKKIITRYDYACNMITQFTDPLVSRELFFIITLQYVKIFSWNESRLCSFYKNSNYMRINKSQDFKI